MERRLVPVVVDEVHYVTHEDFPEVLVPVHVKVAYTMLDDGFLLQEIIADSLDYDCQNILPI